ncbi:MAG: 2'-5' RNA ligase family protein [Proteobacteria bacterium]|nr:2'-5' RNA ligase family protein [Pseudomonadota bacterium]
MTISSAGDPRGRRTEADGRLGQPVFAVNLQANPGGASRAAIVAIQDAVAAEMSAGVFRTPPETLHLTVFPIVWARGDQGVDIRRTWAGISADFTRDLKRMADASPAFELRGARLDVMPAAIILRFEPSPALEALRERISAMRQPGGLATRRPNLAHMTLFRFETAMPLSPLAEAAAAQAFPEPRWTVDRLVLSREKTYPSLQTAILAEFDLRG